jgi:SHS2 domain-containing protein
LAIKINNKMYETFEHQADIGIRGKAKTLEKVFEELAKAMFSVEVNVKKVKASNKVKINCKAENNEELLIEWLNSLLSQASLKNMVFSKFKVKIKTDKILELEGEAFGEKLSKKHEARNEIKGATYSQLKVYKSKNMWIAQCIVDV